MLRRLQTSQLKIEVLKSGEDNSSYTSIDQVTMRQQRRQSMPAAMAVGGDLRPVLRSNWLTLVLPSQESIPRFTCGNSHRPELRSRQNNWQVITRKLQR